MTTVEVTIKKLTLLKPKKVIYKVTRRVPEYKIADTEFFKDNKSAKKKYKEWMQQC